MRKFKTKIGNVLATCNLWRDYPELWGICHDWQLKNKVIPVVKTLSTKELEMEWKPNHRWWVVISKEDDDSVTRNLIEVRLYKRFINLKAALEYADFWRQWGSIQYLMFRSTAASMQDITIYNLPKDRSLITLCYKG